MACGYASREGTIFEYIHGLAAGGAVDIHEYQRGLYVSRAAQRLNGYRQYNMGVVVVLMEVLIYWLTKRDGKRQTREFIGQIRELIHRPLGQHGAGSMR